MDSKQKLRVMTTILNANTSDVRDKPYRVWMAGSYLYIPYAWLLINPLEHSN